MGRLRRSRRSGVLLALVLATVGAAAGLIAPSALAAAPLTITSPASGTLLPGRSITVTGTGTAGDQIQVGTQAGGDPACIATVAADDTWSCSFELADGRFTLTAVELLAAGGTTSTSVGVAVLGPPVIESVDGSATSAGSVSGTAYPGAGVAATSDGGASCLATADSSGRWFCQLAPTPAAGSYRVTATQTASFAGGAVSPPSAAVTLVVDTVEPDAPTVTSPAAGAALPLTGAVYTGTGVDGTRAFVYVDRVNTCDAAVTGGVWTCTGGTITAGAHRVSAIAGDAAGNYSSPSPWLDVTFAATTSPTPSATAPTPSASATGPGASPSGSPGSSSPTPQSTTPRPSATATPSRPGQTAPTTPQGSAPPGATEAPAPGAAPTDGPPAPVTPPDGGSAPGGWSAATGMTTALSAGAPLVTMADWMRSLALAIASLALVVVPARLAVAGRAPRAPRTWRLTGRNRARIEFEDRPERAAPSQRTMVIGMIGCAAGLVLLSGRVDGQPAYLRLLIAVIIAVALVNAVAAGVPAVLGRRLGLPGIGVAASPRALLLVGGAALLSRFAGLDPAFLFGVVIGLLLPEGASAIDRAKLATARVVSLLALGGLAWGASALVPADGTFVAVLGAEVLSATTLLAVGSSVVLLFPVGRPAGQSILRWSPALWLGLTLLSTTVLFLLLTPTITAWSTDGGAGPSVLAVVAFGAVCTSIWAWRRFVDPE
ncbi:MULTISPECIES: hypothetical protein [unclassified Rathayibacter]|uniref:hypothetical protein n=1 Tax=unclassified Rathayibacter TaxID=2609250 RepID=UPI0006FBB553|nr:MULTISPECIES: hypothetical protein [unclassified Rathayibacter]KQQ04004.1 hypothetical protein ASF42_11245 [Rathayibacter sp. Leaf294]KQS12458.1 hypothetical protein ASG06_11245 [Rathayibacter sp. Leaf185]